MRVSRVIKQAIKVAVSLFLLSWLLATIDWRGCMPIIARADWVMMLLAVVLLTMERVLSVAKWLLFLKIKGSSVSFWRLFIINYIGGFWGLVLPSSVSADIVRGYYLSRVTADLKLTVTSMAADRFISGVSLVCVAFVGGWYAGCKPGLEHLRLVTVILGAVTAAVLAILFNSAFLRWFDRKILARLNMWRFVQIARQWMASCLEYRQYPTLLIKSFGLSIAVQAMRVFIFYVVSLGFGLHAPLVYFVVFVPLIMVLIMLPVSLNGIGVREVSFVGFFAMAGLPEIGAFVVSFTVSILTTLTTALGGIIYMFDRSPHVTKTAALDGSR